MRPSEQSEREWQYNKSFHLEEAASAGPVNVIHVDDLASTGGI